MTVIAMPTREERAERNERIQRAARLRVNAAKLRKMADNMMFKASELERQRA